MAQFARLIRPAAVMGSLALLFWLERRRPLRRANVGLSARRVGRNMAISLLTAGAVNAAERPLTNRLTRRVEERRLGLAPKLPLPRPMRTAVALILLDYTLYWWHILLHRVPGLWRMHAVHHFDLALDTTTALRFHFAEFLASIPWRLAQVRLIGVDSQTLQLWQQLTVVEVFFHHANVRLPLRVERVLSHVLVTPRLHGIHHSIVPDETDSNFSSGLAVWDVLHRTRRTNVPQQAITVGLPAERDDLTLGRLLMKPVTHQESYWCLPGDGVPRRQLPLPPPRRLAP